MRWMSIAFCLVAGASFGGGMNDEHETSNPCPKDLVLQNDGSMTDEMFRQWIVVRALSCGAAPVAPRAFFDRATGERLTDEEITRRIFNGSTPIAPVPIPASGVLLLCALVMLWRRK